MQDEEVVKVIECIKETCEQREETVVPRIDGLFSSHITYPLKVQVGGVTVFVMDINQFVQF